MRPRWLCSCHLWDAFSGAPWHYAWARVVPLRATTLVAATITAPRAPPCMLFSPLVSPVLAICSPIPTLPTPPSLGLRIVDDWSIPAPRVCIPSATQPTMWPSGRQHGWSNCAIVAVAVLSPARRDRLHQAAELVEAHMLGHQTPMSVTASLGHRSTAHDTHWRQTARFAWLLLSCMHSLQQPIFDTGNTQECE
jgi:hypothetical protein